MGKKIKLNKGAYVNEEGYIVNPEIPRKKRPSLQKSQPVKGEPLATVAPKGKPIEDYKPETIGDTLTAMHEAAVMSAGRAKGDGIDVKVSPVVYARDIDESCRYFTIEYASKGYTVYQIASEIYFRESSEFDQIVGEIKDGVPGKTGLSLCYQYKDPNEPMQSYNVKQREDCFFIIASIFSSLTGNSYSETKHTIDEKNCVIIKRTKIGTDGLVKNSLRFKEAKEGTPE